MATFNFWELLKIKYSLIDTINDLRRLADRQDNDDIANCLAKEIDRHEQVLAKVNDLIIDPDC